LYTYIVLHLYAITLRNNFNHGVFSNCYCSQTLSWFYLYSVYLLPTTFLWSETVEHYSLYVLLLVDFGSSQQVFFDVHSPNQLTTFLDGGSLPTNTLSELTYVLRPFGVSVPYKMNFGFRILGELCKDTQ
jgi:hypothetical protein